MECGASTIHKPLVPQNQMIGIIDSYGYGSIVGKLVWQRLIVPMQGGEGDDEIVEGAKRIITLVLSEIERIKGSNLFLVGSDLTLADCFLAPIFAYLTMTPDHSSLLNATPNLARWWESMNQRVSMQKTPPEFS